MDLWQTIYIALGGSALVIGLLTFLAKSLFESVLARDTKVFEANLKSTTDAEMERLKTEINRSMESYKVKLKKSEVFFLRELEAASAFSSLFHSISPKYIHPDMEWYEACDALADEFGRTEVRLDEFMSKHGAMLDDSERELLADATSEAAIGKFEVVGGEIPSDTNGRAGRMYDKLKRLEERLIRRVREQASL